MSSVSVCVQYYQLKHGFQAVLEDWQLARLRPVFRCDTLAITSLSPPPHLAIHWETVGDWDGGCYKPNIEFEHNILDYRYNKFLNIGQ